MTYETLTSRSNPRIVEAGKLNEKKFRQKANRFCFEGRKLLSEAVSANVPLDAVFLTENAKDTDRELLEKTAEKYPQLPFYVVTDAVYEKISGQNAPEGIFCIAKYLDNLIFYNIIYKKRSQFPTIIKRDYERIFVCDGVRDPGNLGTVIRTANALGFDRLVLSSDCADIYNPKTIRAAMGALFRLPLDITEDIPTYITSLREAGYDVRAAALHKDAEELGTFSVSEKTVFVVGNEGHGLSEETIRACAGTVLIPMAEGAESFNAAIAAALLMWEQKRIQVFR